VVISEVSVCRPEQTSWASKWARKRSEHEAHEKALSAQACQSFSNSLKSENQ
jgi:hypothetical protein